MEIAYSWSWFQASNWNSCWCQIHSSLCKKNIYIYLAFFLFQVNNQWGFCHLWVSVNLEHTSWNLLNDLSICICTEHSSFGKCSEISQRKGRLKYYITYFGWYSRFLIQKYLLFQNLWIWKWSTFDDWMKSHDCSESHLVSHSSFCCHQLRLHFIITIIIVIIIVRLLTRVSTTNYYWLGNLSNRHLFSHISGGWTSKIKVAITGLASSGSCLPCL